jgi:cytochrome b561
MGADKLAAATTISLTEELGAAGAGTAHEAAHAKYVRPVILLAVPRLCWRFFCSLIPAEQSAESMAKWCERIAERLPAR